MDGRPGAENDLHMFQQLPYKPFISIFVAAQTKLSILYLGLSTVDAVNTWRKKVWGLILAVCEWMGLF